jgi:hypothetical protein
MRKILLASAALMLSTGLACAQSATPSPAPAGSTSGAMGTTPGMSAGQTTPPAAGMAPGAVGAPSNLTTPDSTSGMTGSRTTPAATPGTPSGATTDTGATNSQAATPSTTSDTNPDMSAPKPAPMKHHMSAHTGMPSDGTPGTYLHIAKDAIRHHNAMRADDALSHAETLMLTRAVPQDASQVDQSPGVSTIEDARKAVKAGDMQTASSDIDKVMGQMPHMMHHHPMSNGTMSHNTMSHNTMSHDTMGTDTSK